MNIKPLFSRRKHPIQARSTQTVDAIYEATAQLLERDEAASTNRIAERAGVSIGTLYQYFPNATAILAAIVERERHKIADQLRSVLADFDPDAPEQSIRLAIRALLGAFDRRQRLRRRIILTFLPMNVQRLQTEFLGELMDELLATVGERAKGRLRPLSPVATFVLSRALLGAVRGALVEEAHDIASRDFEDELVALVTGYVLEPRDRM